MQHHRRVNQRLVIQRLVDDRRLDQAIEEQRAPIGRGVRDQIVLVLGFSFDEHAIEHEAHAHAPAERLGQDHQISVGAVVVWAVVHEV